MRIILIWACLMVATAAQAGQTVTPADLKEQEEQMRKAQQMMNSPEYKKQMQDAMQQMKKQGIDASAMPQMQGFSGKAMEAAMGMNRCMQEKLGDEGIKRMSERGKAFDAKLKALCGAGKKEEAEQAQKDFAKEMMASNDYKAMKTCSDRYKHMMNDPAMASMRKQMQAMEGKHEQKGVCS